MSEKKDCVSAVATPTPSHTAEPISPTGENGQVDEILARYPETLNPNKDFVKLASMYSEMLQLARNLELRLSARGVTSGDLREYGDLAWNDAIDQAAEAAIDNIDPDLDGLRIVVKQAVLKLRRPDSTSRT